ncbi:MAG: hypothetical protein FWE13_05875 [Firmicutes bacterium]|nr:hypothetical protein [Bacillota bacterium]
MKNNNIQNSMMELVKACSGNLYDSYLFITNISLSKILALKSAGEKVADGIAEIVVGLMTQGGTVDYREYLQNTAILTANEASFTFYVLKNENLAKKDGSIFIIENLKTVFEVSYNKIQEIKITNFLCYSVKVFCEHGGQKSKIKIDVFKRKQKKEALKLISHLRELKKQLNTKGNN